MSRAWYSGPIQPYFNMGCNMGLSFHSSTWPSTWTSTWASHSTHPVLSYCATQPHALLDGIHAMYMPLLHVQVVDFFSKHYGPKSLTVAVVGDVTTEQVRQTCLCLLSCMNAIHCDCSTRCHFLTLSTSNIIIMSYIHVHKCRLSDVVLNDYPCCMCMSARASMYQHTRTCCYTPANSKRRQGSPIRCTALLLRIIFTATAADLKFRVHYACLLGTDALQVYQLAQRYWGDWRNDAVGSTVMPGSEESVDGGPMVAFTSSAGLAEIQ